MLIEQAILQAEQQSAEDDIDTHLTQDMKVTLVQFTDILAETSRAGMMLPVPELQKNLAEADECLDRLEQLMAKPGQEYFINKKENRQEIDLIQTKILDQLKWIADNARNSTLAHLSIIGIIDRILQNNWFDFEKNL